MDQFTAHNCITDMEAKHSKAYQCQRCNANLTNQHQHTVEYNCKHIKPSPRTITLIGVMNNLCTPCKTTLTKDQAAFHTYVKLIPKKEATKNTTLTTTTTNKQQHQRIKHSTKPAAVYRPRIKPPTPPPESSSSSSDEDVTEEDIMPMMHQSQCGACNRKLYISTEGFTDQQLQKSNFLCHYCSLDRSNVDTIEVQCCRCNKAMKTLYSDSMPYRNFETAHCRECDDPEIPHFFCKYSKD